MYAIRVLTEEHWFDKDNSFKRFNSIRNLASQPGRNYIRCVNLFDISTGDIIAEFNNFERVNND